MSAVFGHRWDEGVAAELDFDAALPDDVIERALRELTGVHRGPVAPSLLARVVELRLSGHSLADLEPLAGLPRLQRLTLRAPSMSDLRPLGRLAGLKELALVEVAAADLSPLARLDKLERLQLDGVPARELEPLRHLSRLTDLCLRRLSGVDLRPLSGLGRLGVLELTDCGIVGDLSPLASLPRLAYVNLSGTRVTSTSGLGLRPSVHIEGLDRPPPVGSWLRADRRPAIPPSASDIAPAAERLLRWPCRIASFLARDGAKAAEHRRPKVSWSWAATEAAGWSRAADEPAGSWPPAAGDPAASPWALPAGATVDAVIDRLWLPLKRRAPRFVDRLREQTAALALLEPLGGEPALLAYVLSGAPADAPALLIGRAPSREIDANGARLPVSLRELYSVHAGLLASTANLLGPSELAPLDASCGRLEQFRKANRGAHPHRFRRFLRDAEGGEVLDLERLDGRGDPIVRRFYRSSSEVAGQAAFWDWFEDHAPELFLGVDGA
jgi:hypothetical protein